MLTTFGVAPAKEPNRITIEAMHGLSLYAFTTDHRGAANLIAALIRASGLSMREVEDIAAANVSDLRAVNI